METLDSRSPQTKHDYIENVWDIDNQNNIHIAIPDRQTGWITRDNQWEY